MPAKAAQMLILIPVHYIRILNTLKWKRLLLDFILLLLCNTCIDLFIMRFPWCFPRNWYPFNLLPRCLFAFTMGERILLEDTNSIRLYKGPFLCPCNHGNGHRWHSRGRGSYWTQWRWWSSILAISWLRRETPASAFPNGLGGKKKFFKCMYKKMV